MAKLEKYSIRFRWGVKNVTNGPTDQRTNGRTDKAFLGVGFGRDPPASLLTESKKNSFFYASHKCGHLHLDLTDETFHGPYNEER